MLNGKFFTGLPPKMIDKNCAAPNRLESHIFWPDDSKAETAAEARIKRRNSMQGNDRPVYEKQKSVEANDVNTKERFSKEFSKSSIQFYDNLNDSTSTGRRRSQLPSRAMKKSEIAEKPTATKVELSESVVDEAYTNAKKKQAYTSNIEFYDYVNEEGNERNNLRKPKMDMNDKREMELNSKNSPKLQMKRDVRSLSKEKELTKLNNREVKTLGRSRRNKEDNEQHLVEKEDNVEREDHRRINRNLPQLDGLDSLERHYSRDEILRYSKDANSNSPERYKSRDEKFISPRQPYVIPKKNVLKPEKGYSSEIEKFRKSNNPVLTRNDYDNNNYRDPDFYKYQRHSNRIINERHDDFYEQPKYLMRYNSQLSNDYPDNGRAFNDYAEQIDARMKNVRIQQSPPRRHQHRQYFRAEEEQQHFDQGDNTPRYSRNRPSFPGQSKRGTVQRHLDYIGNERYEADVPSYVEEEIRPINSSRANFNRVNNKLNNETHTGWADYTSSETVRRNSSKPTNPSPSATSKTSSPSNNNSTQKHLRSSLCFHDGAIIAENDATRSPTTATPRRNARSSATKRVSVGLPD